MNKTFRLIVSLLLLVCINAAPPLAPAARAANTSALAFTVPVATSFSTYVPANRQSAIALQGSDAEATALTYAIASGPSHGSLSGLNASTGAVVYTPVDAYTGADSFTYTVTSGGETSAPGTVTLTVTNQKTRITDTLINTSGAPRIGTVTFILTQAVASPGGLIPAGASVSATLNGAGAFDVSVFPSKSLSPQAYYQVYFSDKTTLSRELIGIYEIPFSTSTVSLAPYKVLDTNLAARYTFASSAAVEALTSAVATATLAQLLAGGTIASLNVAGQVAAGSFFTSGALTAGSVTTAGTVTAAAFTGNGAGLTGIPGGTGGVSNTGSTTIAADSNNDGVGIISFQTGGVEYLNLTKDYIAGRGIETATGAVTLQQHGGITNDGLDDSAALLAALNTATTPNRPKTILVAGGIFDIQTTVTKNFGATYDVLIEGNGSDGILRIDTGEDADGIVFNGGNSITLHKLAIIGKAGQTSAGHAIKFNGTEDAQLDRVFAYGLTTKGNTVEAVDSMLDVDRSNFLGCSARGDLGSGVIHCNTWRNCRVTRSRFYDQGAVNGTNLNVLNATAFWIRADRPHGDINEAIVGTTPASISLAREQGVFYVGANYMDEGAQYAVMTFSDLGGGAPPIEHVVIEHNRINVTNAAGGGLNIQGTRKPYIGLNTFGYTYLGDTNAIVLAGAGDVTLNDNKMEQRARTIAIGTPIGGTTDRVTIIDGSYANVFSQVSVLLDIHRGAKRKVKTYAAGTYTYSDLAPIFDLEVPNSISLGGEATWIKGTGAPSGGCSSGSFYSRVDGGVGIPGLYVCENSAWAAK